MEELYALQLQINPHFLSNTLNTIRFMAQVAKYESIERMTEALIQIMDCTFRDYNSQHSVQEELSMLRAYLYIMKIRYAQSFEDHIVIGKGCQEYRIPKLILQPFVENAIIHGFECGGQEGRLDIVVSQHEKGIEIMIEDNGCGMNEDMLMKIKEGYETKPGRIGIYNVKKRLSLCYGERYSFWIESRQYQYTRIRFVIPAAIGGDENVFGYDCG